MKITLHIAQSPTDLKITLHMTYTTLQWHCWYNTVTPSRKAVPVTLLKSDVTRRDHVVRCRGSQECGSRIINFACQFHSRWHSLRITLKDLQHWCACAVVTSEPRNRDNGASDVWALTT